MEGANAPGSEREGGYFVADSDSLSIVNARVQQSSLSERGAACIPFSIVKPHRISSCVTCIGGNFAPNPPSGLSSKEDVTTFVSSRRRCARKPLSRLQPRRRVGGQITKRTGRRIVPIAVLPVAEAQTAPSVPASDGATRCR